MKDSGTGLPLGGKRVERRVCADSVPERESIVSETRPRSVLYRARRRITVTYSNLVKGNYVDARRSSQARTDAPTEPVISTSHFAIV
ncbi:hypothetical protein JYU34_000820 [Plutella xylostella]|uniref:Uncharacterized protein n=1 Tax=Plutella xylostella TaxID=51655 RepID=A0ABQ7R8M8_PLUXY|nr:hypothetical protein JYU34_000820 [Plutella xylostella]